MSEIKANEFLEKEPLGKLMVKYCVPCVISLLVAMLYNIVDQIFIANADYLGSYGNAASSVVFPLTVAALGLAMMIGDGCCTIVSMRLGAKDSDSARRAIGSSIISLVVIGVVLMLVLLIFPEQILTLFGATVNAETFAMAKKYLFWIAIGIPFYMFGQAMNPIVRSDGSPRFAMAALLTGAGINIILDPVFIFVCRWGMMGAAVATILGQIASALLYAGYLFKMKAVKLDADSFKFRFGIMKQTVPLGMASLLTQLSIVLSIMVVLNMVKKYGALDPVFSQPEYAHIPTAVVGIVIKFYQVMISVSIGLATGSIPIAGYNLGAQRADRVRSLMRMLLIAELIFGLVASAFFLLFATPLTNIFGGKSEGVYYTDYCVKSIRIFMCLSVLSCINKGVAIFQQAIGNAKAATGLSMLREIVFGITMPIILPIFIGLDGVLWFMPVADLVAFVVSMLVVFSTAKKLRGLEKLQAA